MEFRTLKLKNLSELHLELSSLKTRSTSHVMFDLFNIKFSSHDLPTRTADVLSELGKLSAEVSTLEKRLSALVSAAGDSRVVSREERDRVTVKRDASVNEWRRRKRMCEAVIDAVLESYPKSKRILVDDMGIELDEDVGVKVPKE